ncbi:dienelactone hydrolase family protein [Ketobacter sp.]|uniref:dienelactone hydrolase family protein n=1 Tax=Ketobacter sp. TaxID=2083498 RepID=UPI000F209F73|nr:dienelactone hydrolase family protein [Ketobacter sp.]RLT95025.1 MAG: dienelactone hydrolase family protein [Ketobacter sp.]
MRIPSHWFGSVLLFITTLSYGQAITYQVDGQPYEGYYVTPTTATPQAKAPLVILLHDWDGLTDYEIKRAEMLQQAGYAVFAADLFGQGVRPTKVEDKQQHTGALYKDRAKLRRLVQAAVDTAKAQGAATDNQVVMGYCFGGAAVLEHARAGADSKGFVTFHGGLSTPGGQSYAHTQGSILVFHGSADSMITLNDLAQLGNELEQNKIPHELITYGGAPHAFTVFGSDRYRAQADQQSWTRFLQYLNETLHD